MVYRGRPSASCFACRERRIKCDRLKPKCTQCTRIHIECPGYRDPLDQNFRDESENVVKRAQKSYRTLHDTTNKGNSRKQLQNITRPSSKRSIVHTYDPEHVLLASLTLVRLTQPIEDAAVSDFMSSYIPGSHFDYLPFLYGKLAESMVLAAAVDATSIATLARKIGRADLLKKAHHSYVQALLETNAALANQQTAVEDTTLVSVLLLGLFEANIWSGSRTPDSWTTHTRGALALIKLRGPQQFETQIGRQLFVQVANIISVNSIQRKERLPQELMDLIYVAMQHEAECPKYRLACLTGEISVLLATIDEGRTDANSIMYATRKLDDQYIAYADSLLPPWRYQEIIVEMAQSEVYGNTVHQYASHRAAGLWNSYRMTRILLNELIYAYSTFVTTEVANVLERQAIDNIEQMAVDICASIPQFTNPAEFAAPLDPRFPCSKLGSSKPSATPISSKPSAAMMLWPLSVVRSANLASVEVRMYATERLKHLGREFHIPQAEKLTMEDGDVSALQDGLHMFYVS